MKAMTPAQVGETNFTAQAADVRSVRDAMVSY